MTNPKVSPEMVVTALRTFLAAESTPTKAMRSAIEAALAAQPSEPVGWKPIEEFYCDNEWSIFMFAWPHPKTDIGWAYDFWSVKHLREMQEKVASGWDKNSPHLFWVPTHYAPLPPPPNTTTPSTPPEPQGDLVEQLEAAPVRTAILRLDPREEGESDVVISLDLRDRILTALRGQA